MLYIELLTMSKLISKQLTQIIKNPIPNINIIIDVKNIKKIGVVFYYKKDSQEDELPLFYPDNDVDPVLFKGEINLEQFPINPPKLILLNQVAHSHVYDVGHSRWEICFSLDRSYQTYFSEKTHAV